MQLAVPMTDNFIPHGLFVGEEIMDMNWAK